MSLIGRSKELDRILSVIRGPRDSALAVAGPRGIGKSALLAEIPSVCDCRTVFLGASASESDWPLSGLTALLNGMDDPVLNRVGEEILDRTTASMDTAGVSTMLLTAFHQRSSCRTVIVIDDADQLDPSSQTVLGFLARRLAGTDIALFVGIRDTESGGAFSGLPILQLGSLDHSDLVRMLESIPTHHAMTAAAHAAASAAQGNPLAAAELYHRLLERQAEGEHALPIPLPGKSSFEGEFALVVGGLTPTARRVLELLSLSYRSEIVTLEKICPDLWAGVDELLANGVVSRSGSSLQISQPLLRGHVFAAIPPASRTADHRALAEAAENSDAYGRRWHLSFTALERQTPFCLLSHAIDLIRAGETAFALEFVERALTINPCETEMAARLTTVAELLFNRGQFTYARRYLEWAQRITRNPALILRLTGLSFEIAFMQGASVRSSMVLRLVKEFGQHDPSYAATLLAHGALYFAERWELVDAAELLRCGTEFQGSASLECLAINDRAKFLIESIRGETGAGIGMHEPPGNAVLPSLLVQGRALSYAERHGLANEAFTLILSSTETDRVNWRETAALLAVDNEIRAGRVRAAVNLIDEIERRGNGSIYHRGLRHVFRLWRAHAMGDEAAAQACAADAQRYIGASSHPALTAQLAAWQGHFALLRGDLAEALAQLSRATEIGMAFGNPSLLRCEPDLIEVLVRLGRHREATQTLLRLESRAVGLRSPWLIMAVTRSRAMLADGEKSLQLFSQALDCRPGRESLLERARTLMCYAERLNAFGRVREAREALMRAKVMFDEAGACAWVQHIDALLLDERVQPAHPQGNPALLVLADHERALAKMVARGMRNKEIAAMLFVSVRTVEVRLTTIYRKLGVESRAQLTALAASKQSTAPEPYALPLY